MCSIKRMLICICCLTSLSAFGVEPFLVPAIGDIDKSFSGLSTASGEEIVLTMPSGALLALKQDRTLLNDKFPFYPFGCYVSSSPLLYDYDKDGQLDIAFFTESPAGSAGFHIITSQTSNLYLIDKLSGIPVSRPIIVDVLTNESYLGPELIYIADSGCVNIVNLFTKTPVKAIAIPNEKIVFLTADGSPSAEGVTNLIWFTDKNRLFIYNPSSETTNFVQAFSHSPISAPVVGEFSGNGSRDTAFLLSNGEFVVVSKNHSIIKQQLGPGKWDGFAYGDFNQDGQCEFLVVSSSGQHCLLRIINGSFSLTTPSDTYPLLFSAGGRFLVSGNIGGIQSLLSSGDVGSLARFSVADGAPEYSRWGQFAHVSTLMVFDGTEQGDRYFSPNADGVKDFASLGFFRVYTGTIGQQYKIIDTLVIKKSNMIVRTIPARQGAGDQLGWAYFQWDGKTDTGLVCGEGCYDYTYTSTITAGGTGQYSINGKVFLDVTIPQVDFAFTETAFTSLSNVSGMKTNTIIESTILDNFDSVTVDVSFLDYKNEVSVNSITQTVLLQQPLSGAFSGRFSGMWNGTGQDKSLVNSGIYIYQARVTDLAGNTAKKILTASEKNQKGNYVVFNDAGISIPDAGIFASPTLFNPANVVQKTTTLSFDVQHRILEAVGSGLNDALYKTGLKITVQSSTGSLVRTLYDSDASGLLDLRMSRPGIHDGTRFSIVWDGIQNDLKVAQGGEYTFKVILTDAFGESVTKICPVTIDNPQPEIREIAQQPDGRYKITGKAVNRRGFSSYAMFFRKTGNSIWNRLPVPILQQSKNDVLYPESNISYSHVDNGLLANWDVFGLQSGQYEIMVAVTGTGGVFSAQTNIGVNNPFSIRDFSVDTVVLSPNGDGVQDRVKIFALLPDAAQCTLIIKDKNNTVVCSSISNLGSTNYPQQFMLAWNGMGVSGNPVTAGRYTVEAVFNNGTASVVRRTNITVIGTNDGQSGSGFTNVTLISPTAKNPDGSHKYTLGIPYTWHATARGTRTPIHQVDASIQASGTQEINRYPSATAVIEIGCAYNKIKVDRISWAVKMQIRGWFLQHCERTRLHTIDYTNRSGEHVGFLVERNISFTNNTKTDFYSVDSSPNMTPSQEDRFSMHYKASDIKDYFGPDTFGYVKVVDKKIESRNASGDMVDISDAFNWNIGLDITRVSAGKVFGESFAAAAVAVGSYFAGQYMAGELQKAGDAILIANTLLTPAITQYTGDLSVDGILEKPDSVKQDRLKAFNTIASIGCQLIPPPAGAVIAGAVAFIANIGFGDYSDEVDIKIPIKLNTALSFQNISEYGFSDFFMNDMAKQVTLSCKEGVATVSFPGLFSKFNKYQGILVSPRCYTNIVVRGISYIPLRTRMQVLHGMIDIVQGSCFTNEQATSKFWAVGFSSDTNGDPVVRIRNNFRYTDTIPWPLISRQQFYSYASDGRYEECLSNASQGGVYGITTNISAGKPFSLSSIHAISNTLFYIPSSISNILLYSSIKQVSVVDANGNPYPGLSSDADPSLLQRVIPIISYSGSDAGFSLSTAFQEDNYKLDPAIYGHIGLMTNISAVQTNSVFVSGYHGVTCTSGWSLSHDTFISKWEYVLTTFEGSSHPFLKCISPANSSNIIVASNSETDTGLRKIYPIYGSAYITGFTSYKVEYGLVEGAATQPTSWHMVPMPEQSGGALSRRAVVNGIIGLFDVTGLKEGQYRILLTVEGTNTAGEPLVVQKLSDIIWYNEPITVSRVNIFCSDDSEYFDPEKGKLQFSFKPHPAHPGGAFSRLRGVL